MADSTNPRIAASIPDEHILGTEEQTQPDSTQERLADLTARATALYAVKKYEEAAELYSEATEVQSEMHGEMAEENADLLFAYGRCLFYVAQKTSTVLGGTAASAQLKGNEKKPSKKRKANGTVKPESSTSAAGPSTSREPLIETSQPADIVPAEDAEPTEAKPSTSDKPLFQIEGDAADWADSDDEDGDDAEDGGDVEGEGEGEEEEEEDDFNTAFEILDMSRILYLRKLERIKSTNSDSSTRDLRIRISDIYDLQAEISLEGERFDAAVNDLRSCLEMKESLYDLDSSLLAECHYKLSLALEAACQIQQRDKDGNPVGEITVDWNLRNEAVAQQELAVESCKLRINNETKEMEQVASDNTSAKQKAKEHIEDVQDMVSAMEQRLEELKKPPVSVKAEAEKEAAQEMMGSVLGQMLGGAVGSGGNKDEQKDKLAEIMAGANDLSGMVKRKKPKPATNGSNSTAALEDKGEPEANVQGKGKRKIAEVQNEAGNDGGSSDKVKKVRIADVID